MSRPKHTAAIRPEKPASARIKAGISLLIMSVLAAMMGFTTATAASANGQETCPNTTFTEAEGGWVKYDGLTGTSFDIPDKAGFTVTDVCYKASTEVVYPDPITDPVVSTVTNKNGQVQDLSHVSVYYTKTVTPPTEVTPVAPVFTPPTCAAPGTLVGTDTAQYTWVRSGPDSAAVLTAQAVGNVVLTGKTVYGPYDLTQLSGEECEEDVLSPVVTIGSPVCTESGATVLVTLNNTASNVGTDVEVYVDGVIRTTGPLEAGATVELLIGGPDFGPALTEGSHTIEVRYWSLEEKFVVAKSVTVEVDCTTPPTEVTPVAPVFTPPTCAAPGTLVGTDTAQYTWVRSGPDSAAVLTAQAVGNVVLTGKTVYGPYDLTQLSGEECAPPPATCPAGSDTIVEIPIGTVVRGDDGEVIELDDSPFMVPDKYIGGVAFALVQNQESVHPGSDLIVVSGGKTITLENVEREPYVTTSAGPILLGEYLKVSVRLGEDGVFSGGGSILVCGDEPEPEPEPYIETRTRVVPNVTCTAYTETTINEAREWRLVEGDMLVPGEWYEVSRASSTRTPTATDIKNAGLTCATTPPPTNPPTTNPPPAKPPVVGPRADFGYVADPSPSSPMGFWAAAAAMAGLGLLLIGSGRKPNRKAAKH